MTTLEQVKELQISIRRELTIVNDLLEDEQGDADVIVLTVKRRELNHFNSKLIDIIRDGEVE